MDKPLGALEIDPTAQIDADARIYPSTKGSQIAIGPRVWVGPFVVNKAVGGVGGVVIGADSFINPIASCITGVQSVPWRCRHG